MHIPIYINWFEVIKIQKDYKIKTAFILLEVGDGTVRPPVQMFVQNCFLGLGYWCKAATKNHCWLLNQFFFFRSHEI